MKFLALLALPFLSGLSLAASVSSCTKPVLRKEWRSLSKPLKIQYIEAVKCLQVKQPKFRAEFAGARSRFDDFQGLHIKQTDSIHFVGHFQAWHRWFVATYEKALRQECGYTGAQPYWVMYWTMDASPEKFIKSPVFDPIYGFGGNGPFVNATNPNRPFFIENHTGGGCVKNGPFVNMSVNMGPGNSLAYNSQCLIRDLAPEFAASKLKVAEVQKKLAAKSFAGFDILVQGGIQPVNFTYHGGGHIGVGGELGTIGDVYASPGDPLFFLHHANMDRLWWIWQKRDFKARSRDIAGPMVQFTAPFDFFGPGTSPSVTLDFVMNVSPFVPSGVKVKDIMDIQKGVLCYNYDSLDIGKGL